MVIKLLYTGANVVTGQTSSVLRNTPDTGFSSTVNGSSFTSGYSSSELDAGLRRCNVH